MFRKNGMLTKVFITSKAGNACKLRSEQRLEAKNVKAATATTKFNDKKHYLTSFDTKVGLT